METGHSRPLWVCFFRGYPSSLPEFLDFKLFGKTVLVANNKFEPFLINPLREVSFRGWFWEIKGTTTIFRGSPDTLLKYRSWFALV